MKKEIATKFRTFDFYVLLFFLTSFVGWLWEVGIYFILEKTFVNRGVNRGPYLPIYGMGSVLLWFLLHKLYRRPILTFFSSMFICTALEYATSLFLEKIWGVRWWDYSNFAWNIQGRVCLIGAVCFGLGGVAMNCFLLPLYMKVYHRIRPRVRIILCLLLLLLFLLDATYSAAHPNPAGMELARAARLYSRV